MKLTKYALLGALILSAWSKAVRADSYTTFDFAGTFRSFAGSGNFTGSVTIDATSGHVSSFSFTDPFLTFGGSCVSGCDFSAVSATEGKISGLSADHTSYVLGIGATTLVGISDLNLITGAPWMGFLGNDYFIAEGYPSIADLDCAASACYITSASVTATTTFSTSTPEPSTLALLGSGVGILVGLTRRKRLDSQR